MLHPVTPISTLSLTLPQPFISSSSSFSSSLCVLHYIAHGERRLNMNQCTTAITQYATRDTAITCHTPLPFHVSRLSFSFSKNSSRHYAKNSSKIFWKKFLLFAQTLVKKWRSNFYPVGCFLNKFRLGASIPHDQVRGVVITSCRNERTRHFSSSQF